MSKQEVMTQFFVYLIKKAYLVPSFCRTGITQPGHILMNASWHEHVFRIIGHLPSESTGYGGLHHMWNFDSFIVADTNRMVKNLPESPDI